MFLRRRQIQILVWTSKVQRVEANVENLQLFHTISSNLSIVQKKCSLLSLRGSLVIPISSINMLPRSSGRAWSLLEDQESQLLLDKEPIIIF